jgi:hypothetical protein
MIDSTEADAVIDSLFDGSEAARVVMDGGAPNLDVLDRYAWAMEVLRVRIAAGTMWFGWVDPTEDDLRNVRNLVQLVREGASPEALAEPALRAYGVRANPWALCNLCAVLPWLAGEARRIAPGHGPPKPDQVRELLDTAAAYFERGGEVAGFAPSPEDLARVRRLRELVAATSEEELSERRRLVKELEARLPEDSVASTARLFADQAGERYLDTGESVGHLVARGRAEGESAAWAIANGGTADLELLDRFVQALEVIRQEIAEGRLPTWKSQPTEEDVRTVRHLARLVREGAPPEALVEPALRAYAVTANPSALNRLAEVLPWLAGEATRMAYSRGTPKPDDVLEKLDKATAYFERGGDVSGFVPTPEDAARVRRLRELVTVESDEELAERQRLAKQLWARLPQDYSARVHQNLTYEEG